MPIEEEVQLSAEEQAAEAARLAAEQNQGQTIPLDALPEDLRGKTPAEIKATLSALTKAIGTKNDESDQLKRRIADLESRLVNPPPPQNREEDPDADKPLEELIVTKPKVAIQRALKEMGIQDRFENVERTAGAGASEAAFMRAGTEFSDFDEYEDEVKAILSKTGAPASYANVRGAYFMALGARTAEGKGRETRARITENGTEHPAPKPSTTRKVRKLTALEREIARGQGFIDEKGEVDEKSYLEWYDKEYMEVDVPTGKKGK